jgi:uncharacterized protein (DUF305 family)
VRPILRTLALPAALVGALVLASCGTSANPGGAKGAPSPNAKPTAVGTPAKEPVRTADVDFATMEIAQHKQSVVMADLAVSRSTNARVKALASTIKKADVPELTRMSGWFTSVGSPVPTASGEMAGMALMGAHPEAVMSAAEMTSLSKATGSAFDRKWLQMMVRHHKGTLAMAKTGLAQGGSADIKEVAQSIVDRQPAQIATMTSMLAKPSL